MNRITVSKLTPGMQLSRPVVTCNGEILLESNIVLSDVLILLLKNKRVQHVYIKKDKVNRSETLQSIFDVLSELTKNERYIKDIISESISWKQYQRLFQKLLSELEKDRVLQNILVDIFANDPYVFKHSLNVAIYSIGIAQELRVVESLLFPLFKAALFHDIGKIFLSKDVINKNGRLTDEEYEHIQLHSLYGFKYLKLNGILSQSILLPVLQHHERLDGSGYPSRTKGEELHLFAKIIAVADVFDALSTDRCYRKALTPHEALLILKKDCGIKFNPEVIHAFSKAVIFYPKGLYVELSTGAIGYIKQYQRNSIEKPIVQVREYEYDLEQTDISIVSAKPLLRYSFNVGLTA
ncbi:HD-GYP domain-containing protein [Virgibacillus halodenitrificans]|uniref:HD-GYP domain-containing protein n=1 Tax=Virgibacillus halodenitrificans TaxID=1482 RepID=UPI0013CED6D4|nr:HD-GYP domain-containing protein [Virgibacillus halodenitrificans]